MFSFIKNLFSKKEEVAPEVPYKIEAVPVLVEEVKEVAVQPAPAKKPAAKKPAAKKPAAKPKTSRKPKTK